MQTRGNGSQNINMTHERGTHHFRCVADQLCTILNRFLLTSPIRHTMVGHGNWPIPFLCLEVVWQHAEWWNAINFVEYYIGSLLHFPKFLKEKKNSLLRTSSPKIIESFSADFFHHFFFIDFHQKFVFSLMGKAFDFIFSDIEVLYSTGLW